ncbi:FecR family protein [Corticibacter populi]|nr:FecR domain-containing protein [Corticibacter populi]RZS29903.1 FecR family protein [Corticibacter populi]
MNSSKVHREAAQWFAHMQNVAQDDVSERARFERWLLAHPMHTAAYQRLALIWEDFDSPQRLASLASAAAYGQGVARRSRRKAIKGGLVGAVAVLGVGTVGWRVLQHGGAPDYHATLHVPAGQAASVHTLPDGSRVTLGAATRLSIRYERDARIIELHQGVAAFEVQADALRPFVVNGEYTRVTVLGTYFVVDRLTDTLTRVSVERGRVRVARMRPWFGKRFWQEREHWILGAGEVIDVREQGGERQDIPATDGFAWQRNALVFSGATLQELATRLSRYSRRPVLAPQERRGNGPVPRIVAVVQFGDIEQFIDRLPALAAVDVEQDDAAVYLYPR